MKFKLEGKDEDRTVTVEFGVITLQEFDEHVKDFLRGCGFVLSYDFPEIAVDCNLGGENENE